MNRSRSRRRSPLRRMQVMGMVFVAPAAIYIAIFHLYPLLYGMYLSFTDYDPLSRLGPQPNGVENYLSIFRDSGFLDALLVTGKFVLQVLPITVAIALVLALMVNKPRRGIGFFRTALYIPHILSMTAVSIVWLWLYSQEGWFNHLLGLAGFDPVRLLLDPDTALSAVAGMRIWKALGSNMVLLLAGLQSIPRELYEAAQVDGAGVWARFRYVTLPGLRTMLTYVIVMDIIYLSQSFAEMFVLTAGGPIGTTTTVNYVIYLEAFQFNRMGTASAMGMVLFALIAGFSFLALRSMARKT